MDVEAFARAVGGIDVKHLALVERELEKFDFRLAALGSSERDEVIRSVVERIREDSQLVGSQGRQAVWERGWAENSDFFDHSSEFESLVPKFIRPSRVVRWQGKYVRPYDSLFEAHFSHVLRAFVSGVFQSAGVTEIHEFGAGTGWNLVDFGRLLRESSYPADVQLFGSDFVQSAVQLMGKLNERFDLPILAQQFDMRSPDYSYGIGLTGSAGVFTFGSIEQLAGDYEPIIEFFLQKKPQVVVSIEPDIDTYDETQLEDYLAKWFQSKRGYSAGLISHLRSLETQGLLVVDRAKRIGFGSVMMEGYNLIIWRPTA